jgi:hypothetical protein
MLNGVNRPSRSKEKLLMLRPRFTYGNVLATLAIFFALTGGAVAVNKITSSDVRDRSLTSRDFKSNSANGRVVKERSLGAVPRAQNASRLGGHPASRFLVSCPSGTKAIIDVCIELQPRPAASYRSAAFDCSLIDNRERIGRRLPTHQELMVALADPEIQLAPGGELTANVYPSGTPGQLDVLYITEENGNAALTTEAKPYRCVTDPMN